jgi:glycogen debranching enzyme
MSELADSLVIKDGGVFAVIPRDGPWSGVDGVWMDDCRHVSRHELLLDGAPPRVLDAGDDAGHTTVHRYHGGGRLERRVHADGTMVERVVAGGAIELDAEGDFITMLGLRGFVARGPRAGHATELRRFAAPGELRVEYRFSPAAQPPPAAFVVPRVDCDDERFAAVLRRAFGDLRMLLSSLDGEPYFAAGVPWYATLFGRDSLIAALQTLAFAPAVAAGTLRLLAARIGREYEREREEEPGKILHELRPGEHGTPLARYYGSVDATPLFLRTLEATGDGALQAELRPAAQAARAWIATRDPLTYDAGLLRHQGWKDSQDGVPAEHPIALIEPQAYAGRDVEPFWLPRRGFYAMALGSGVLASNQGHVLWAQDVAPRRARAIRDALMSPAMFSGWGIRTLAADEPLYDPLSYHRGSVWPHDSALIAAGLRRHGFDADFLTLFDALVDAAAHAPAQRLPELFGGQPRVAGEPFVAYPVACRPQAWAAGAIPFLLAEGLRGPRPLLPRGVGELEVEGVLRATRSKRDGVRVRWGDLSRSGCGESRSRRR